MLFSAFDPIVTKEISLIQVQLDDPILDEGSQIDVHNHFYNGK